MKKHYLLTTALLVSTSHFLNSQITFTSSDLQESGKTYITATDTTSIVDIGSAGPSAQSWDFSSLVIHYMSGPSFDLTSNTAYAGDYPNSDLYTYGPAMLFGGFYGGAPVSSQGLDNGYMFWRKDTDGFWTEGFMADEGPYAGKKVYTVPQELILGTPATLNTSYPNFSEWKLYFDLNPSNVDTIYQTTVNKVQNCDAWGSLETPYNVYPDVLRIHEYGVKVDSAKSELMGNPLVSIEVMRDTFNNYIFVTNGIHYPLAIVKADKNNLIRSVEYYIYQGNMGVQESEVISPVIYPNPSNGILQVDLPEIPDENAEIILFDTFGKIIANHHLEYQTNTINYSTLPTGVYFYTLSYKGETINGKIILN